MPRIGLISDTHGVLDPHVPGLFAGVDHILHAGDVGWPSLLDELAAVAPVTAVTGNTDCHPGWQVTEVGECSGCRFLVQHIVEPRRLGEDLQGRIRRARPHVVVFGHTHRAAHEVVGGVHFVNPGSASQGRGGSPRTVGLLEWDTEPARLRVEFITLGR